MVQFRIRTVLTLTVIVSLAFAGVVSPVLAATESPDCGVDGCLEEPKNGPPEVNKPTPGGESDAVGAKQIVFISGAWVLEGGLNAAERTALQGAVIVLPEGLAGDFAGSNDAGDSPYFAAKELTFMPIEDIFSIDGGEALLANALVVTDGSALRNMVTDPDRMDGVRLQTTFIVTGTNSAENEHAVPVRTVRGDTMPEWFADDMITGFGAFVTNPDNMVTDPDRMDGNAPDEVLTGPSGTGKTMSEKHRADDK